MLKIRSIKLIIYSEYFKAALLPILIIELTLLITYFIITNYLSDNSRNTLQQEATRNIEEIASRETRIINEQIDNITRQAVILQKENSRLFTKPEAFALPAGIPEFDRADNGVHYKAADNGGSSLWYSAVRNFTPAERMKAVRTEAMDPLFKLTVESNPAIVGIYFNSWDSLNRYYPFLMDVWKVFTPTMNIPEFNFYYLADAAHDPAREVVWTDTYLDPVGQGWMASCIAPVYRGNFLEGVTGIDITIDRIIKNILAINLPWGGGAFLVDQNGVIIAMPEKVEEVLLIKELLKQAHTAHVTADTPKPAEFNLLRNRDPEIAAQIEAIFKGNNLINYFNHEGKNYFLTQSRIDKTGWRLMILVDRAAVNEPVNKLDKLTRRVGLVAFIMMIVFYTIFFSYLMYKSRKTAEKIALPLSRLAERTGRIKDNLGERHLLVEETEIEEINLLNNNFIVMAEELGTIYDELESKVHERTVELQTAMDNLQNAQKQIIEQEKMASIGQLAAGVAHEINNPMAFIITNVNLLKKYFTRFDEYAKLLESDPAPGETARLEARKNLEIDFIRDEIGPMLDETLNGTQRVKKIVNELRTFSRLTVDREMADINGGIESVIRILWNEIKYKADVKTDFGQLPPVLCNSGQINQVFMNIILNASQAIVDKGIISIVTGAADEKVTIRIEDTGPGMSAEIMKRIFDPFFTTKEPGKGTGLGLSVTYEIIKKHHGTINVESTVGKGTVFTVTLPVNAPQDSPVPVFTVNSGKDKR